MSGNRLSIFQGSCRAIHLLRYIRDTLVPLLAPFATSPRASIKALQPQAISVLRAMCFFDPTDIREHYLTEICAHYSSHNGKSEAALADFPIQPDDLLSALDELMKEELISFPAYSPGMRVKDDVRKEISLGRARLRKYFARTGQSYSQL